jgi:hypothetical protein
MDMNHETMPMTITSTTELNNGVEISLLGLGVFRSESGTVTKNAVRYALEAGYRHTDTAKIYGKDSSPFPSPPGANAFAKIVTFSILPFLK